MAIGVQVWSTTASNNSTADTNINWAEGMAPSQVNDSSRAEMASVAKWRDDNNGSLVTGGSTLAYTITSNQIASSLTSGYTIAVQFHATNDTSATLAVDGLTAKPLQVITGTNVLGGEFLVGNIYRFTYSSTGSGQWILNNFVQPITNTIANSSITYAKLQNESATTLLGNPTGAPAAPSEIGVGAGLIISGTNLSAPAFPPTAAFKNLSIKVTGGSSILAAADFVTLATSGSSAFQTVAFPSGSISISSGASGAAGGIDVSGAPTASTCYAVYGIATAAATSVGYLISTSFTTPAMPTGYTYKARIGAVLTATSTASVVLNGTYQFGRQARYITGIAGTGTTGHLPIAISGISGNVSTPTYTAVTLQSSLVPPTASGVMLIVSSNNSGGSCLVAPNANYGSISTLHTNPPPFAWIADNGSSVGMITLETSQVYYAASISSASIAVYGWEDNI